jgi:DNA-binding SARP family transcriptional activator/predicted ATPase
VHLRLLGPLEVVDDNGSVVAPGGRKQRIVLAAMALTREVVSADRLADLVWGDDPPASPFATLQVYVSTLRKLLATSGAPQVIARQAPGYRLGIPDDSIDLRYFERLLREAQEASEPSVRLDRLDRATALWRGELLADLADEPFVEVAAARLNRLRREATALEMEALIALERYGDAIVRLEDMVRAEPSEERLWSLLMTSLYRVGRASDASAAYARARDQMFDEAGVEPSPQLAELQRQILSHELPVPARHEAPQSEPQRGLWVALGRGLVGRDAEVSGVSGALGDDAVVTVTGPPGSGKSALAAAAALRSSLPVAWVSLDDRASGARTLMVGAMIAEAERAAGSDGALIVLDGGDGQADEVRAAVDGLAGRSVLLARVAPLGVRNERVVALPPLPAGDAVALFRDRAARVLATGGALPDDLVGTICESVDRLPLGIELAAAQLRTMALADLAERVAERIDALNDPRHAGPIRHRSLGGAFEEAVTRLDASGRDDLVQLAVFRGGWNLDAMRAVLGAASTDRLDNLVQAGLVWPDRSGLRFRYRLPTAVRDLVLADGAAREETRRAHAVHFAAEARRWRFQRVGYEARQAAEAIRLDEPNIVAAFEFALELDDDFATSVAISLGNLFYTPERLPWLDERLGQLVARDAGVGADRHRLKVMYGHCRYLRAGSEVAVPLLEQAAAHLDPCDDQAIRARTLLAQIAVDRGDPRAVALVDEAVESARNTARPELLSQTLDSAVLVAIIAADLETARRWALDKLDLDAARRDDFGRSFTLLRMSWIAYLSGEDGEARRLSTEAGELARELGNETVQMYAQGILGQALLDQDLDAAGFPLIEAAKRLVDEGVPLDTADAVVATAAWCASTGREAVALRLLAAADQRYAAEGMSRPWYLARLLGPVEQAAVRMPADDVDRCRRMGAVFTDGDLRTVLDTLHDRSPRADDPGRSA